MKIDDLVKIIEECSSNENQQTQEDLVTTSDEAVNMKWLIHFRQRKKKY